MRVVRISGEHTVFTGLGLEVVVLPFSVFICKVCCSGQSIDGYSTIKGIERLPIYGKVRTMDCVDCLAVCTDSAGLDRLEALFGRVDNGQIQIFRINAGDIGILIRNIRIIVEITASIVIPKVHAGLTDQVSIGLQLICEILLKILPAVVVLYALTQPLAQRILTGRNIIDGCFAIGIRSAACRLGAVRYIRQGEGHVGQFCAVSSFLLQLNALHGRVGHVDFQRIAAHGELTGMRRIRICVFISVRPGSQVGLNDTIFAHGQTIGEHICAIREDLNIIRTRSVGDGIPVFPVAISLLMLDLHLHAIHHGDVQLILLIHFPQLSTALLGCLRICRTGSVAELVERDHGVVHGVVNDAVMVAA